MVLFLIFFYEIKSLILEPDSFSLSSCQVLVEFLRWLIKTKGVKVRAMQLCPGFLDQVGPEWAFHGQRKLFVSDHKIIDNDRDGNPVFVEL